MAGRAKDGLLQMCCTRLASWLEADQPSSALPSQNCVTYSNVRAHGFALGPVPALAFEPELVALVVRGGDISGLSWQLVGLILPNTIVSTAPILAECVSI